MSHKMSKQELEKMRTHVLAKAWKDPIFKEKLIKNPKVVLKEMGYNVPENIRLHFVENTPNNITLVIPSVPEAAREMSDEELKKLAAAAGKEWTAVVY